jgi:hypothetical protein
MLGSDVLWRALVLLPYAVLAVVVGVAYGLGGLLTLAYFYVLAGAWLVLVLVGGSLVQTAGRKNAERVWRAGHWSGRSR